MTKNDTSRDEYIKAIYKLTELYGSATNKKLADHLKVSAPSVTEMVKRLIDADDVYADKKAIYLTEKGIEDARRLLTKHRLWEIFLVEYLGYSWQDVHADADELEHATSVRLKDRLNDFLNHPKHCPHGSEIFENHPNVDTLVRLSDMKEGEVKRLHKIPDDKEFLRYLEEKGISLNKSIKVIRIDNFDKSIIIEVDGTKFFITEQVAHKMKMI